MRPSDSGCSLQSAGGGHCLKDWLVRLLHYKILLQYINTLKGPLLIIMHEKISSQVYRKSAEDVLNIECITPSLTYIQRVSRPPVHQDEIEVSMSLKVLKCIC